MFAKTAREIGDTFVPGWNTNGFKLQSSILWPGGVETTAICQWQGLQFNLTAVEIAIYTKRFLTIPSCFLVFV